MIDVTRQVLLFRKLLLCCLPKVAELDYKNGCTKQYWKNFERACWEITLERSLLIDYPEVKGVEYSPSYPSSGRVIDPEAPTTHKLVCLPKEEISGIWFSRDRYTWHYLDRDQLLSEGILWTEESLENFVLEGFGSWEKFLDRNQARYWNPNEPVLSIFSINDNSTSFPNVPPMDSVSFYFRALNGKADFDGVAKAEDFTFYLKEIVPSLPSATTEGDDKKETPKMSEEQGEMVARIGAVIDKRMEAIIDKRMKGMERWWK